MRCNSSINRHPRIAVRYTLVIRFLLAGLFLALASTALASTTWYVNGVSGSDSNNCTSQTTACKSIGHAISLALSGDSIMVAPAAYSENLTIGSNLTLIGSGAATTIIDGGGVGTVVSISKGWKVSLSGFSIVHGFALLGAGISNSGVLKINQSIISGNQAHSSCGKQYCSVIIEGVGIYNHGSLSINYSTVTSNSGSASCSYKYNVCDIHGAGIYNHGGLTINNSTVTGNGAFTSCAYSYAACYALGGGIFNAGGLTVNKSTINSNNVNAGGCFSCFGWGGGTFSDVASKLTITNSTFTGNSATAGDPLAGGGGIFNRGTATASNATFSGNGAKYGGNIDNWYLMTVQNSIVANSSSGGNCYDSGSATITSNGYNLSSDATCPFSGPGDMNSANPMLGPLQNNGGPTLTVPLTSGSPAIDAGNPSGCTNSNGVLLKTDQRGYRRPDKEDTGGCDIGAYESQSD
jgi:hypothetical protein